MHGAFRLVLLSACLSSAAHAKPPLTVERLFADPPLAGTVRTELRWLTDGSRVSFIERAGGAEDAPGRLLLFDPASGAATVLADEAKPTTFPAGETSVAAKLANYAWSPRGDAALLHGGGELFLLAREGGAVRRLTASPGTESNAQFSPDGRYVAFVRDNDLYAIELASGREIRLSHDGSETRLNGVLDWLYDEELAGADKSAFRWSPDGLAIVYLTLDQSRVPRFPLSDLLPLHPAAHEVRYPLPGDPNPVPGLRVVPLPGEAGAPVARTIEWTGDDVYVPRLGWFPDGKAVWYQVLDRAQQRLELFRLDLASGTATLLLTETDPAWINLHDQVFILKNGSFVFGSERDGYQHLYLHDAQGRVVRRLTSGEWIVDALVRVDEAARHVYFRGTRDGTRERHLYRVPLAGGPIVRLTAERGVHVTDVAPGGRFILDTVSRADTPPQTWVLDPQGRRVRALAPNERPPLLDYALGTTEFHEIQGPDGTTLHAALLKPPGFDPARRYPVVVFVYGGPHAQVVQDAWARQYALFHQYLAGRGVLVFSLDNRGSFGRGRAFERALLKRMGRAELDDQLAGVAWLARQSFVDARRIGIWGWSYGGYLTIYALANAPETFCAGAAVAPVTDWRMYDTAYTERYLKLPAQNAEGYRDSSPVHRAGAIKADLLVAHGTADDNVHWRHSLALLDALYRAGVPYDLQLYPGKDHRILGKEARVHLFQRIAAHFARALNVQ